MKEYSLISKGDERESFSPYYVYNNLISNIAPIAVDDYVTTYEDTSITIHVIGNDIDFNGDNITVVYANQAVNGYVSIRGNEIVYRPDQNFWGEDSFKYIISDGNGGLSIGVATVYVESENDDPWVNDDSFTVYGEKTALNVLANDSDTDADDLSVSSVTNGANGTVEIYNNRVVYNPNSGFVGSDEFTYVASDGNGGFSEATVYVNVEEAVSDWKIDMRSYDVFGVGGHTLIQFWNPGGELVAQISAGPENTPRRIVDIDYEISGSPIYRADDENPFMNLFSGSENDFNKILSHATEASEYINKQELPYFALPLTIDGAYYNSNSAANTVLSAMAKTGLISPGDVETAKDFHNSLYLLGTPGKDKDMFQGDDWWANKDLLGNVFGSVVKLTENSIKKYLLGATGDDVLIGDWRGNYIDGAEGDDKLVGLDGSDYLVGGAGNDTFYGGLGDDVIIGGDGEDNLRGGFGADILTGGLGEDTYIFEEISFSDSDERDIITDFTQGSDTLDFVVLAAYGIYSLDDLTITNDEVNTVLKSNNHDFEIEFSGVIALNDSDFIWG